MTKRVQLNNQNNGDTMDSSSADPSDDTADDLLREQPTAAYPKVHVDGTRRNSDEDARPEMPLLITRLFTRLINYFFR